MKLYNIEMTVGNGKYEEYTKRYQLKARSSKNAEEKIIQSFLNVGVKREQIMLLEHSIEVEFDGEQYNYMVLEID